METKKAWKFGGSFFRPERISGFKKTFIKEMSGSQILLVVSAVEGVTRLLRLLFETKTEKVNEDYKALILSLSLNEFHRVHDELIAKLFTYHEINQIRIKFEEIYVQLQKVVNGYKKEDNEEQFYASLLKFGELSSSLILHSYLNSLGIESTLFDAREYVVTTNSFKEASIFKINPSFSGLFAKTNILVTQGFIGKTRCGNDSVLGFDGSDLSAAYFAVELNAELTFWKDVKLFKKDPSLYPEMEPVSKMLSSEFQRLETHPIRPDAVAYAIEKNLKVKLRCFLCPEDYEAIIY